MPFIGVKSDEEINFKNIFQLPLLDRLPTFAVISCYPESQRYINFPPFLIVSNKRGTVIPVDFVRNIMVAIIQVFLFPLLHLAFSFFSFFSPKWPYILWNKKNSQLQSINMCKSHVSRGFKLYRPLSFYICRNMARKGVVCFVMSGVYCASASNFFVFVTDCLSAWVERKTFGPTHYDYDSWCFFIKNYFVINSNSDRYCKWPK